MDKLILAIDMGGTKTTAGVFEYDGKLLESDTIINPITMDENVVWQAITDLVDKVSAPYSDDIIVCGVAAAGPMTAKGKTLSPSNTPAWNNFPFREKLEQHIKRTAYVENDCNALALGEAWKGAAQGFTNYMSMVVSTGIGAGVVVDNRLLHGNNMNAGEIGHTSIDPDGVQCICGSKGCVEAYASGPSLQRIFGIRPEEATDEMIQFCADKTGFVIANAIILLDIRHVTIGGSVALGFGDKFFNAIQARVDDLIHVDENKGVKIVPSTLGQHGGLISAARVGKLGYRGNLWEN